MFEWNVENWRRLEKKQNVLWLLSLFLLVFFELSCSILEKGVIEM
jgi:hypothetical protein